MPVQDPLFLMRVTCGAKDATLNTTRRLLRLRDVLVLVACYFGLIHRRQEVPVESVMGFRRTVAPQYRLSSPCYEAGEMMQIVCCDK